MSVYLRKQDCSNQREVGVDRKCGRPKPLEASKHAAAAEARQSIDDHEGLAQVHRKPAEGKSQSEAKDQVT